MVGILLTGVFGMGDIAIGCGGFSTTTEALEAIRRGQLQWDAAEKCLQSLLVGITHHHDSVIIHCTAHRSAALAEGSRLFCGAALALAKQFSGDPNDPPPL